ncbi:DUF4926 domain-containing protein [Sandarakinorhabdus sp.]|uniref:DUF4926 domain-containing protein n=1 Tax=Sandarakinorhabdus sp. TaxID=1916663 RepID=UPI003F6E4C49
MNVVNFPLRNRAALAELDSVRLAVDVAADGVTIPAGAEDVVVAVYANGKACEVEFIEPVHAVVTIELNQIA